MQLLTRPMVTLIHHPVYDEKTNEVGLCVGRREYDNVDILNLNASIGEKIESLEFDSYILYGVLPVSCTKNVYECKIDYFVIK